MGAPNPDNFLSNSILAYALFTILFVFESHFKSLLIIVPRSLVSVTVSKIVFSSFSLVLNWKLFVKFDNIVLFFEKFIIIFWFFVHKLISSRYLWDSRFSAKMNWISYFTSFGTWFFILRDQRPMVIRFTISNMVRSSTNLNLSSGPTLSALLLDCARYSRIPRVAPWGPPPLIFLGDVMPLLEVRTKKWD